MPALGCLSTEQKGHCCYVLLLLCPVDYSEARHSIMSPGTWRTLYLALSLSVECASLGDFPRRWCSYAIPPSLSTPAPEKGERGLRPVFGFSPDFLARIPSRREATGSSAFKACPRRGIGRLFILTTNIVDRPLLSTHNDPRKPTKKKGKKYTGRPRVWV
jgi:hypothetical protein